MTTKKIAEYGWHIVRINEFRTWTPATMKFDNTVLSGKINKITWRSDCNTFSNNRFVLSNIKVDEDFRSLHRFNTNKEQEDQDEFIKILNDKKFRYCDIHNYRILQSWDSNTILLKNPNLDEYDEKIHDPSDADIMWYLTSDVDYLDTRFDRVLDKISYDSGYLCDNWLDGLTPSSTSNYV
jgi:hypothetical protein